MANDTRTTDTRRLMDSRKIMELGWRPTTELEDGLKKEYEWFLRQRV